MWKYLAIWIGVLISTWPLSPHAELTAPITMECRSGEFVVGLVGKTGAWIDSIAPICAHWDERNVQSVMARSVPRVAGGTGGARNQQTCPDGTALMSWKVEKVLVNDAAYASAVVSQCRSLLPPHAQEPGVLRYAGAGGPPGRQPLPQENCPAGQVATGVHAWVSHDQRFVTEVKMNCGPAPFVHSDMTTRSNPDGSVTYFSPTLVFPDREGIRVDWCRDWAANCGAPAADAFCHSQGMGNAASFDVKADVPLTIVISSRRICRQQGCKTFERVDCGARK